MEEISLYGPGGKPDWFWKLNPKGTVPVLVCSINDASMVIPDSDGILDAIGEGQVPSTTKTANDVEKQQSLGGATPEQFSKINTIRQMVTNMLPVGKKVIQGGGGSRKSLDAKLRDINDAMESPFVCGNQVTIADCAMFPFLWRLEQELGLDDYPKLQSWLTTCGKHPAFAKTISSSWWWWW